MEGFRSFIVRIPTVLALVDPNVTYVGDECQLVANRSRQKKKSRKHRFVLRISR